MVNAYLREFHFQLDVLLLFIALHELSISVYPAGLVMALIGSLLTMLVVSPITRSLKFVFYLLFIIVNLY